MSYDVVPDGEMTAEQAALSDSLTPEALRAIDDLLLANTDERWRKVAYVVGKTMGELDALEAGQGLHQLPDVFFSFRVRHLVQTGVLEAVGWLESMRYSEIRRASDHRG